MALIFITGASTAGKSTIATRLVKRGYEAYDTDHDGISAWYSNKTGDRVAELNETTDRSEAWLNSHQWLTSIDWVKQMSQKALNKPIFICGGSHNKLEVRALCDKVIWLTIDEPTIRKRLAGPRDHNYGTNPHELALILKWNKINQAQYRNYGAIMIDATQPLEKVVRDIIKAAEPA